jgi:hypothetical protein
MRGGVRSAIHSTRDRRNPRRSIPPQQRQHIPPLHGIASPEARAALGEVVGEPRFGVPRDRGEHHTLSPSSTMTSVFRISQYSSARP